jgi:hypothetical protein
MTNYIALFQHHLKMHIRSVIAAIKNSYKPLCKHDSDNQYKPDTDVVKAERKNEIRQGVPP